MKKRIVSLLLAVLMVTGTFPVQVFAADENISVELESSETTPCDICGNEVCTCESTGEEGEQTEEPEQPEEPVEEEKYAKLASSSGMIEVAAGTDLLDDASGFYYDEFEENTIFLIKDSYVADNEGLWYKVEVYSGGVKESVLEEFGLAWPEEAWILYDYTDESYDFEATLVFVERCEICGEPGCETEHVKCEVCGEYDCDLVHFYCDICEKHDCGVTHPYCVVCEKVDCGVKHTYCGHCGAIDCEIEHEDLYTPETEPIIPENPTLPEGEAVSVVDEFGDSVSEGIYLGEGEKASFSAWADDASSYQWQVCYNNANDLWIDIYGANEKGILVSPAMFLNIINYQGETYLRCVVTTGEETVIGEAIPVTVLEAVPVEAAPMMYAARNISEGSSDQNNGIATAAEEGNAITHSITVSFVYDRFGSIHAGEEAAQSWTANLPAGGNYTLDVPFPDVPGYRPAKVDNVDIAEGVDRITRTIVNIQAPIAIYVDYVPDYVDFKVEHYWQNIADDNYTLHETSTVTGLKTGEPVSNLEKSKIVKNYTGFADLLYDSTITVAADGSTVVKVYYDRNYAMIRLNLAGGHGAEPIYARYGTPVVIANPERAGHTFAGWDPALPSTVPASDTDYTAKWTVANANYTIAFWYENANDKDYTYVGSIQKTGTTGAKVSGSIADYNSASFEGKDATNFKRLNADKTDKDVIIKEDGTSVVNVYIYRETYTLTYYKWKCLHTHTTACCSLQHTSHSDSCCSIPYHVNHTTGCITNDLKKNTTYIPESDLNDAVPNRYNGVWIAYKYLGATRYYVWFDGNWYRTANGNNGKDAINWNCMGQGRNYTHDHTSGCTCTQYHDHSSGLLSTCNSSGCTHVAQYGCESDKSNMNHWTVYNSYTVKYQQDVSAIHAAQGAERWCPGACEGLKKDDGTYYASYGDSPAHGVYSSMGGGDVTFFQGSAGANEYKLTFWLETYDGKGGRNYNGKNFAQGTTFTAKMGAVGYWGDYDAGCPTGFKVYEAWTSDSIAGNNGTQLKVDQTFSGSTYLYYNFYYIRETYPLDYFNGSTKVATRSMKYDELVTSSYNINVSGMVCPYGEGYEFGGWYLDPTCTVPVTWGTIHMPEGGMAVYAKWTPIIRSIKVTIDTGNGETTTEIEVAHGSAVANPPENPTKVGFNFVGWFYTDPVTGKENAFHFSMPVYRDMNLYAKWTSNSFATGTIYYKIQGTDTEVAPSSNINGTLGSTKTYSAKIGDEFYEQYRTGYFPVVQSHNVKFDYADNNTYTFYYKEMDEVEYTVNFIDTETGEKVIDLDTGNPVDSITGTSKSSKITVDAINLRGYTIDAMSKEFVLSSEKSLNVFNFYYTRDEENATVQIEHYIQNLAKDGYIHYFTEPTTKAKIGTVVTANAMTIDGFTYASDENNGKTLTEAGVVIKLYYTRNSYNYTFNFYINGTTTTLADSVTGTAVYGKTVNQSAKNIPGYKLVSATTMSITVGTTSASNVRNFYYEEEDVTIRYQVGAGGGGSVSSASETVKAVNGTAQGSTASVADANHTFVGWFDNYAGNGDALSTELGFVPEKVDNVYEAKTYYAKFAEVKVDINYIATTGGSVSSATEKVDVVTGIAVGSSAIADDKYEFVGWFDNENCEGTALSTTESFKPTRPDEGWGSGKTYYAKFAEKEATIKYVAVGGGSVSPATEPVGMVSGEAVGATATFDANIVVFRGWFDNANGEGTALSTAKDFKPTRPDDGWAETQTYHAVFDSIEYKITFVDRGTTISTGTYKVGDTLTLPTNVNNGKYDVSWKVAETNGNWIDDAVKNGVIENYGDVTIEAEWTINIYWLKEDILTDPNEDSIYGISENVLYGKEPTTFDIDKNTEGHQDPTKAPTAEYTYEFAGWADYPIPGELKGIIAKIATFTEIPNVYTITFDLNGGNIDGKTDDVIKNQDYNTAVTAPANPTKTGYTFAGWDTEVPATMPAGDMTITAQWTINQYTITYNLDGGALGEGVSNPGTYTVESEEIILNNPTKVGYTFAGWTGTGLSEATEDVTISKGSIGNREYTATWTANATEYRVEHWQQILGKGTEQNADNYNCIYTEESIGTTAEEVTPKVKIIEGFTSPATQTVKIAADGSTVVKYYYTRNKYDVTFNNGYGSDIHKKTMEYGADINYPVDPVRTGYTFNGWDSDIQTVPAEDVTITAQWTINQYTITFDTDGGTKIDPITQNYGTTVTAPADPTKTGYTFAGWDVSVPETMPAEDMTITAKWTINQYTITFNTDGGTEIAPIKQDYNTAVTAPADPTKEGYTFAGWDTEVPATMPAEDMTITAQWTINQYTITFDTDGGSAIAPITQDYNTAVTKPADPTKTGYTFAGWDKEIPDNMPAEDMTVKAQWTANKDTPYKVQHWQQNIDAEDEHNDTNFTLTDTDNLTGTTAEEVTPAVKSYTGFTAPAAQTVSIAADGKTVVNYYYTRNEYTVTFTINGKAYSGPVDVTYGSAITVPEYTVPEGYTFSGWTVPETMPAENITLDATLTANKYTVTFTINGKTYSGPVDVTYGSTITVPEYTVPEGHTFSGWTVPTTMPAGNQTYNATLTVNQYTITFDTDGGSTVAPITQDYNTAVTAPANPAKEGYTFQKWVRVDAEGNEIGDYTIPATMPAENVNLKAIWTANTDTPYKVQHWQQNIDAEDVENGVNFTLADTDNLTGTTDTEVTPEVKDYTGFKAPDTQTVKIAADGKTVVNYYYIRNEYTITWRNDDNSVIDTTTVDHGKIPTHADPSKAATAEFTYTFAGWTPTVVAATGNAEYKATYSSATNVYTVIWKNEDGTVLETDEEVLYGTTPSYDGDMPQKEASATNSYSFAGWSPEIIKVESNAVYTARYNTMITVTGEVEHGSMTGEGTYRTDEEFTLVFTVENGYRMMGTQVNNENPLLRPLGNPFTWTFPFYARNLHIKVFVEPINYSITYNLDGGALGEGVSNPATYTIESDNITLNNPTKVGYTFAGWTGTGLSEATKDVTISKGSIGNREYTANWTANTDTAYTVNHYKQNLDCSSYPDDPFETEDLKGTTATKVTPAVKDYEGFTSPVAQTVEIAADGSTVVNYYYTRNKYTVTFTINGKVWFIPFEVTYGSAIPVPRYTVPEGYTFSGWTVPTTMPAGNQTYNATLTVNQYTITFNTDGGTVIDAITQDYNTAVTKPADPTKTGYTFKGWDVSVPATMPAEDMTITAQWTINQYTITFDTDGGTEIAPIKQNYGTAVTAPANPTKTGYTFAGWDVNVPGTMPAEDMTITAIWTANTDTAYKVQHWQQNIGAGDEHNDTNFTLADTDNLTGTTNTEVTPEVKDYTGFKAPDTQTVTITADGKTVVNYYYTRNEYTITYFFDEGNINGHKDHIINMYDYDEAVTAPADPVKDGYRFAGWEPEVPKKMPARYVTVRAQWTAQYKYMLSFNANTTDAVTGMPDDVPVTDWLDEATKTFNWTEIPVRPGYTFEGWSLNRNAVAGEYYNSYTVNGYGAKTVSSTLYAIWKRSLVDLTIKTNSYNSEQSFIFTVTGTPSDESYGTITLEVVLVGTDEITIKDLPVGVYTVTEKDGWSWRESTVGSIEADITTGSKTVEFVFGTVDNVYWLSGYSYNKRRKGRGQ